MKAQNTALASAASAAYHYIVSTATFAQATQAGAWYVEANAVARQLSVTHNLPLEVTASVIAAFSPRTPWVRNVYLATEFLDGNRVGALGVSISNAEHSLEVGFDALKGQKTNAFARNIAGDMNAVTIDTWMLKAAGLDSRKGANKTVYNALSEAVRAVARTHGLSPAVTQALIWIIVRGSAE